MVKIVDVAKAAKVSRTTVSYILNNKGNFSEETKQRVKRISKELGYVPDPAAQQLRRKSNTLDNGTRSNNILFISEYGTETMIESFWGDMYRRAKDECKKNGYGLLYGPFEEKIEGWMDLPNVIRDRIVGGVVLVGIVDETTVETLQAFSIPLVLANFYLPNVEVDCVVADDVEGGYQATKHLLGLGTKEIFVIIPDNPHPSWSDRISGYRKALQEQGQEFKPSYIKVCEGSYDKGTLKIIEEILQLKPKPEAIFAACDSLAESVLGVLLSKGVKVPGKMKLIGFDDNRIAQELNPPLTTVRMPGEQMGREVIRRLMSIIEDPEQRALKITCPVELIIRKSTGK